MKRGIKVYAGPFTGEQHPFLIDIVPIWCPFDDLDSITTNQGDRHI